MSNSSDALVVRALEHRDLSDCLRIQNHGDVTRIATHSSVQTIDEFQAQFRSTPHARHLVIVAGDAVLGFGSLALQTGRRAHVATLSMAIDPGPARQDIAPTLLRSLIDLSVRWYDVKRVETKVLSTDESAVALYLRFGFEVEATHRDSVVRDGVYCDACTMAWLAP